MIRVIALITFFFLLFSTAEAGFWLAGRWFVSSRYASLTLGVVDRWLSRGLITRSTQFVKVFINRNGKWILLTLALADLIGELDQLRSSSQYCHVESGAIDVGWGSSGAPVFFHAGNNPQDFYTVQYSQSCSSGYTSVPAIRVYKWVPYGSGYVWTYWATIPKRGTYTVGQCQVTVINRNIGSTCNFSQAPSLPNLDEERRDVPVRVYPNPADFVRPDVIESDPALRYLRDEYNRISQDASIPDVSSDLVGLSLPEVGWSIPSEEAIDSSSESSQEGSGSQEGSQDGSLSFPGLDTSLDIPQKRAFPVELVNSLVQSHPLLRVLQGVSLDTGGGGSCVIGSPPFEFNFCSFGWILNLMGALIVFISFLTGLFWAGRSD